MTQSKEYLTFTHIANQYCKVTGCYSNVLNNCKLCHYHALEAISTSAERYKAKGNSLLDNFSNPDKVLCKTNHCFAKVSKQRAYCGACCAELGKQCDTDNCTNQRDSNSNLCRQHRLHAEKATKVVENVWDSACEVILHAWQKEAIKEAAGLNIPVKVNPFVEVDSGKNGVCTIHVGKIAAMHSTGTADVYHVVTADYMFNVSFKGYRALQRHLTKYYGAQV